MLVCLQCHYSDKLVRQASLCATRLVITSNKLFDSSVPLFISEKSVILKLALYFVPCYVTSLIFSDCIWACVHNIKAIATHPYRHIRYLNMCIPLQILNFTGIPLWGTAVSPAEQCCCVVLLRRAATQAMHILSALWSLWRLGVLTNQEELDACAWAHWRSWK